ncbi:MAG: methionyl-tRNA formyltransferase, partial [Hydrogenobacter thermophilus]|nr:methionyl-tRNA formyltransferase [Hydrogenobacter thermophilus]
MKIVFMGTSSFAVPSLKALAENFQVVGVITQPDRPAHRGQKLTPSPVKKMALELHLCLYQPEKKSQIEETVLKLKPDCVVVVAYGRILTKEVLGIPPYGCINLHASLLPKYRGAAPIQRCLMAGEKLTGNTVMLMDEGMDTGDIL